MTFYLVFISLDSKHNHSMDILYNRLLNQPPHPPPNQKELKNKILVINENIKSSSKKTFLAMFVVFAMLFCLIIGM